MYYERSAIVILLRIFFIIVITAYQWFFNMILSPDNAVHSNPQVPESTTSLTDLSSITSNHREPALNLGKTNAYKIHHQYLFKLTNPRR